MAQTQFPDVPDYIPDHPSLLRTIIRVVRNIMQGRTNNAGSVTLTANSATTVVTLATGEIGENTLVFFMPQTANAATEFGAGTMYVSARSVKPTLPTLPTFTITHVNNAQTDRTFGYILVG
jgi:hypothetical protein